MNKSEADYQATKLIKERDNVFCPVIKGACRTDCECYAQPKPECAKYDGIYHVSGGYCTNYSLNGLGWRS